MSYCDVIEAEKHRLISERAKSLLDMLSGEDAATVADIMNRSKVVVDKYNSTHRTVINITKREEGDFRGMVKKLINGKFVNPVVREIEKSMPFPPPCECKTEEECINTCGEWDKKFTPILKKAYDKIQEHKANFSTACDEMTFDESIKFKYTLLRRQWKWPELNPLEIALRDAIHIEILTAFQNQNQQLIQRT